MASLADGGSVMYQLQDKEHDGRRQWVVLRLAIGRGSVDGCARVLRLSPGGSIYRGSIWLLPGTSSTHVRARARKSQVPSIVTGARNAIRQRV